MCHMFAPSQFALHSLLLVVLFSVFGAQALDCAAGEEFTDDSNLLQTKASVASAQGTEVSSNHSVISLLQDGALCECKANNPSWKQPARTEAKCIFIDLGAADGNTFSRFLANDYVQLDTCPSGGKWEAWLVEANPRFDSALNDLQEKYPGQVHSLASHAAFSCSGNATFHIDIGMEHNQWGSSLNRKAPAVMYSAKSVTVPLVNVIQLIAESVRPDDWVVLKMDIEGAEYQLMPCLAKFDQASLIDKIYMEEHAWFKSTTAKDKKAMKESLLKLAHLIDIPAHYFSPSL